MRPIIAAICISLLSLTGAQAELVSCHKPDGLILSTANLYFTSRDAGGAAVWRTSQSATACEERILYWETGAIFGDIVFAEVNGSFFGLFFAEKDGVATLRRIPLAGGNATVLATVSVGIVNSHRNLVADNQNVYWQDDRAVRKVPIIGGSNVTVLDQANTKKPTAGIALRNADIIYAFGDEIRFVPKAGAITTPLIRVIAKASSRVTALHVVSNGVYWGEESGAVRLKVGATITTLQPPSSLIPTSISSNGSTAGGMVAFTLCGSQSCRLRIDSAGGTGGLPIGRNALGVSVLSSGKIFWGDAAGVHRR